MRHTLLLAALQAAAGLEIRTEAGWVRLPAVNAGDAAVAAPLLTAALHVTDSGSGLRIGELDTRTGGGQHNRIAVVELDAGAWSFSLGVTTPGGRRVAEAWLDADSTIALVVNTGLFSAEGVAIGLLVADGERRRPVAGWLDAVVAVEDGALRLTDVAGARTLPAGASAFQTLPWLVRDGRVATGPAGRRLSQTHRDRRLTLCLMPGGRIRFVMSNFEVFGASAGTIPFGLSLPEQVAVAAGLGCRDAVALDGGLSAQLAVRMGAHRVNMRGWRRVPVVLLARTRRPG